MKTRIAVAATFALISIPAWAVNIDYVPVGDPGNAADPLTGRGTVGYGYKIGKYDVTVNQYVEFLNTKDPSGANLLHLWNSKMVDSIGFNAGNADGSKYTSVFGKQNHPVNMVTWYDTLRYANWLNNGQGNGSTETGAYTLGALDSSGVPINGNSITRNAGATVFLPSDDEWYKAAFYNPTTSSYFLYPTSNDTLPTADAPPGGSNSANYFGSNGAPLYTLSDVGSYTGTTSPCGAFDMAGNVWNWDETLIDGSARGWRGGSFFSFGIVLQSGFLGTGDPSDEGSGVAGFRVATVPEPSGLALYGLGAVGLLGYWLRRQTLRVDANLS
jgi:sulfatase modifying factor 1